MDNAMKSDRKSEKVAIVMEDVYTQIVEKTTDWITKNK
jgi:hypothetical protein